MGQLKKWFELLYASRHKPLQHQLQVITDIQRRGFLKHVLEITLFGAFATTCCAAPIDYIPALPDMGDSDRASLTPAEADFLGQQLIQQIQSQGDLLNDYDILAYLNDIGDNLVSYSPLAGQDFNFYLIKNQAINAFALPGGYICVYNGLIYTTQSEAEFSSVMAHEIAHVVQHHIVRNIAAYSRNQWLQIAGLLAGGLLAPISPTAAIIAASSGPGIALQNMLAFSRDFEREADRVGQRIMFNAGFDPHAMPSFFQRLKTQNQFNDNEAYAFLRTHPVTAQRLSEAETRANQLPTKMRPDSNSFLLMREKCRVRQVEIVPALAFYQQALKNKKYISRDAQYYGLSFAYYLNQLPHEALKQLPQIADPEIKHHPAVLSLQAQALTSMKDFTKANQLYDQALDSYPNYKNLWLGQVDAYIAARQLTRAAQKLDELSQTYPNDVDIWEREISLYSDANLNNSQKYHYALGNQLYYLGDYKRALEQYQFALKVNPKGGGVLNDILSAKINDSQTKIKTKSKYLSTL